MSDQPFLKCPCQNCGEAIEFPAQGVGLSVQCPHCSQKTVLTGPAPTAAVVAPAIPTTAAPPSLPPADAPRRPVPQPAAPAPVPKPAKSPALVIVLLLLVVGALAAGGVWYFKFGPGAGNKPDAVADAGKVPSKKTPATKKTDAPPPAADPTPASAQGAKSIDDLKPGDVKLEKAKSGNLFYAVGTLKNDSDHQRFGVKVEIEFTDAKGRPAGKTTDYTQVIEPHAEWRFRALVLDSKAASGKVVNVKEDN
jgi:DNA-directed RNA polymerase subunit RPC12/RpoP